MSENKHMWATRLARLTINHVWLLLITAGVITVISIILSSGLEMRMNWTDLLPPDNPTVKGYREIQDRFGDVASLVVVLEGDYDRITEMAEILEPRLKNAKSLYNVQARLPLEFFRQHGFMLLKPDQFKRMLKMYADPSLIGSFRGLNNDYEREYTDSESNLRRDEVDIARSLLGMHRALEVLADNLATPYPPPAAQGGNNTPSIETAVDAMTLGEPWILSLDRRMLLILCQPLTKMTEVDSILIMDTEIESILDTVRPQFPDVSADLTGFSKISQDEMNSINIYTVILSLIAIILIYLILAWSFRGWIMPFIALVTLIMGIIWTRALLFLLFGGLNMFTTMMMLVLLGLGVDFAIHLISRFNEEMEMGRSLFDALVKMFSETGVAVLTGALTTAAAFLTLLIGKTRGVYEFGAASGFGVLLTLIAIFLTLPALMVIRKRRQMRRSGRSGSAMPPDLSAADRELDSAKDGNSDERRAKILEAMPVLGKIAGASWRHPAVFTAVTLIIVAFSIWAKQHIDFEYDFLNLEPKGLRSIQLQREIPDRFGMSDHAAWVVAGSVEESRTLRDQFKKKPLVGDVSSISDYIPPADRIKRYTPELLKFRTALNDYRPKEWRAGDLRELAAEINRFWDNLDLMSNLAYTAGLDRIVKAIDGITGTQTETGRVDSSAVLPTLTRLLQNGIDDATIRRVAESWERRMQANVFAMANPASISMGDLPEVIRRNHLPRKGSGFLVHVVPRKYLFSKEQLVQFTEQTEAVSSKIIGTEQLMFIMLNGILADGSKAALLALLVIIILVLIHFRGPIGLLSLVPLAVGALTMIGVMYIIGEKYNFMNLIAVPIILGIGIDDGIHALHRFRNEKGKASDRIYKSYSFIGRAILLTTLTTMIGFGSISFYTMRGMASFGRVLFMGVGTCFLATILVLPAALRLFTRNK